MIKHKVLFKEDLKKKGKMEKEDIAYCVYCGDNLDFLKKIESELFKSIYIDPPFFTQEIQKTSDYRYSDIWESLKEYKSFMRKRIEQIHRVLRLDGFLLIHCDYRVKHHLRLICDKIFNVDWSDEINRTKEEKVKGFFINEIIWKKRRNVGYKKKGLIDVNDTILFYAKSEEYNQINLIYRSYTEKEITYLYPLEDKRGKYGTQPFWRAGDNPKKINFIDKGLIEAPKGKRYAWNQDKYDLEVGLNPDVIVWTSNGNPRYKQYLSDSKGVLLDNNWDDIEAIRYTHKESDNYPTQKPESLMERLINLTTKRGDLIGDFFSGSGSFVVKGKEMRRAIVSAEQNEDAVNKVIFIKLKSRIMWKSLEDY